MIFRAMSKRSVRALAVAGTLSIYTPIAAQDNTEASVPENAATAGTDARIDYVARNFGISEQRAAEQLALTDQFQPQISALAEQFRDAYLMTIYNYGQPFSIDIIFSRDVTANELQQAVPSNLRQHVKVGRSRFTQEQIMSGKDELLAAMKAEFSSVGASFDFKRDRFKIMLPEGTDMAVARGLVPSQLRTMVDLRNEDPGTTGAGYNTNADDPTHSGKGSIWGGWPVRIGTRQAVCSSSFIVQNTETNFQSLLTAGHCGASRLSIMWSDLTLRELTEPLYMRHGGDYDFQTRWPGSLTTDGYLWIDRDVAGSFKYDCDVAGNNCKTKTWRNIYGGVSTTGYVAVTDAVKGTWRSAYGWNDNHAENDVVCKYGMVTGTTCGRIVDSFYSYEDEGVSYDNFVRVLIDPSWPTAGSKGDSGGAVFRITSTSGSFPTATAIGVVSGGTFASSGTLSGYVPCSSSIRGDCHIIYMPIDRINDDYSLGINAAYSETAIDVN